MGKWHLESLPTGFDYWKIVPGQGDYYNPSFITMDNDTVRVEGYVTNIVTDMGIDWMENQRDKDKPFCLFIHHKACHRAWLPELKYLNEYEDKTFPLPENFYDDYEGRIAAAEQEMSIWKDMDIVYDKEFQQKNPQGKELAEWKFQRYMRDYAKVLKSLDDNVGRVLDYLEEKGMLENTLVVYTSDQGFYMGEHGWFDKRFMYEESMRTPLVMRLPDGLDARGDIPQLVQNIDYAPTFLDIAGAPIPDDIQGVSLLPLLKGEKPDNWRKSLYYHFYEYPAEHMVKRHYGVRTDRWKLIHFYNDIDEWELYDLQSDPHEMDNLYGKPGYEEVTAQLKEELKRLQDQYKDPIESKIAKKSL